MQELEVPPQVAFCRSIVPQFFLQIEIISQSAAQKYQLDISCVDLAQTNTSTEYRKKLTI